MKVKIEQIGWRRAPETMEAMIPYGYYGYLCTAENGIVVWQYIARSAPDDLGIPSGEYELADADWSYDNPRWEKIAEQGDMIQYE